jgi:hypothetical protein
MRFPGIWESGFFSGENVWFCAMNECLFWGKCLVLCNEPSAFSGKNFGLKITLVYKKGQMHFRLEKGTFSRCWGCAPPAPPWIRPFGTLICCQAFRI